MLCYGQELNWERIVKLKEDEMRHTLYLIKLHFERY